MTTIQYDTLTSEQKYKLRDHHQVIDKLIEFGNKLNNNLFAYIFGEEQANRHSKNFATHCKGNVLLYYKQLTTNEKSDLMANIFYNEYLYAHTR